MEGSYTVPMSGPTFNLGIADTAHNNADYTTATFDNFSNLFGSGLLPATTTLSIAAGASFDLNGETQTVAALSSGSNGGSVINSNAAMPATLTLSATGGSTTFSGPINGTTGAINLVMSGSGTELLTGPISGPGSVSVNSGTLILAGSDSYTGGTTVLDGVLEVASGSSLPAGSSLTVGAGGTFIFDPTLAASPAAGTSAADAAAPAGGVAPVPEPGTLVLLAAAMAFGWSLGRRRK